MYRLIDETELRTAVASSVSVAEVIRRLGRRQAGGTHTWISRKIKTLGIDTSHFLGQASRRGKASPQKMTWDQVLVLKAPGSRRQQAVRLRRAMIESGMEYRCEGCDNTGKWQGHSLVLEVDHINNDWEDDRKENLRFLCPNCHAQVTNPEKPPKVKVQRRYKVPHKTKIAWPPLDELLAMLQDSNYLQLGRKLGVSDNAIRKHIARLTTCDVMASVTRS